MAPPPACPLRLQLSCLSLIAYAIAREATMGDKSLKSKQRNQKQKDAAKAGSAAAAKSKQDSYIRLQQPVAKGKK